MKRKGITGTITSIITFLVIAGLFLAVLRRFDGDFVAAVQWILDEIIKIINKIADKVSDNSWFRNNVG